MFQSLETDAVLYRSSQPRSGIQNRSEQDERYLRTLASTSNDSKLTIADCRPRMNAVAQQILGGGTESNKSYDEFVELVHLNIENIHAVRKALQRMYSLVKEAPPCSKWHAAVESTNWLYHIRTILRGARIVTQELRRGRSVLVHCSDGWDRTPQVCALAELMMDPFYRTYKKYSLESLRHSRYPTLENRYDAGICRLDSKRVRIVRTSVSTTNRCREFESQGLTACSCISSISGLRLAAHGDVSDTL